MSVAENNNHFAQSMNQSINDDNHQEDPNNHSNSQKYDDMPSGIMDPDHSKKFQKSFKYNHFPDVTPPESNSIHESPDLSISAGEHPSALKSGIDGISSIVGKSDANSSSNVNLGFSDEPSKTPSHKHAMKKKKNKRMINKFTYLEADEDEEEVDGEGQEILTSDLKKPKEVPMVSQKRILKTQTNRDLEIIDEISVSTPTLDFSANDNKDNEKETSNKTLFQEVEEEESLKTAKKSLMSNHVIKEESKAKNSSNSLQRSQKLSEIDPRKQSEKIHQRTTQSQLPEEKSQSKKQKKLKKLQSSQQNQRTENTLQPAIKEQEEEKVEQKSLSFEEEELKEMPIASTTNLQPQMPREEKLVDYDKQQQPVMETVAMLGQDPANLLISLYLFQLANTKERTICENYSNCNVIWCQKLHISQPLCEDSTHSEGEVSDKGCSYIHYKDILASLIKNAYLQQGELDWVIYGQKISVILNFIPTLEYLKDQKAKFAQKKKAIKAGEESLDDKSEAKIQLSEQRDAIKKKIQQISRFIDCYKKRYQDVFLSRFAQFKNESYLILKDLLLEKNCAEKMLPIYADKLETVKFLRHASNCNFMIVSGETGSGKSTQLPIYLYQHLSDGRKSKMAAIVQPRKISARALAERVCSELGYQYLHKSPIGMDVGKGPGEQIYSKETKVLFMTDHRFIERLIEDNQLSAFSFVMIDEAHERTIDSDIILAAMKGILAHRPDLRVIIASASIELEKFQKYLHPCETIQIHGRQYPIAIRYEPGPSSKNGQIRQIKDKILNLLRLKKKMLEDSNRMYKRNPDLDIDTDVLKGHMLVFLSSPGDIDQLGDALVRESQKFPRETIHPFLILKYHGKMAPEKYAKIFEKTRPEHTTKIILATNIAETSLTFPGLSIVIDTGLDCEPYYNPVRGFQEIRVRPISKSSAIQRAGRAGRTCPGICYRLYSKETFDMMASSRMPEVLRCSIDRTILTIKLLKVEDVSQFDFLDKIPEIKIKGAENDLQNYKALSRTGKKITEIGKQIHQYQLEPFFSRVLLRAKKLGVFDPVAMIIAMTKQANCLFIKDDEAEFKQKQKMLLEKVYDDRYGQDPGDHFFYLFIFKAFQKKCQESRIAKVKEWCEEHFLSFKALKRADGLYQNLSDTFHAKTNLEQFHSEKLVESILKSLFSTHLTNICLYSGIPALGYILLTQTDRFENVRIHPNSLYFGQEDKFPCFFFSELQESSNLLALSVSSAQLYQLKKWSRLSEVREQIKKIERVIEKINESNYEEIFAGTAVINRFILEADSQNFAGVFYNIDANQGKINVWGSEESIDEICRLLGKISREIENERIEIEGKESARFALTKGARISEVLLDDETVKLVVNDVPIDITEKELMQAIDTAVKESITCQVEVASRTESSKCVHVTLKSKVYVEKLDKMLITLHGKKLELRRQLVHSTFEKEVQCKVFWCLGLPAGFGKIYCHGDSNLALEIAAQLHNTGVGKGRLECSVDNDIVTVALGDHAVDVDEFALAEIIQGKIGRSDQWNCTVRREPYISDEDAKKEKKDVLEFLKQEARKFLGSYKESFEWKHKYTCIFSFKNSKQAESFIARVNSCKCPVYLSLGCIRKLPHAKPDRLPEIISIFKPRYLVFEKEFRKLTQKINENYGNWLKVTPPSLDSLSEKSKSPFVKIVIRPQQCVKDLKKQREVVYEVKTQLTNLAKGTEIKNILDHELSSILFTQPFAQYLENLGKELKVFISAKPNTRTITVYGNAEKVEDRLYKKLDALVQKEKFEVEEIFFKDEDISKFVQEGIQKYQRQFSDILIISRMINGAYTLELVGKHEDIQKAKKKFHKDAVAGMKGYERQCAICHTIYILSPRFLICGHVYCHACLKFYLQDLCKRREINWKCANSSCKKEIAIREILETLPHHMLQEYAVDIFMTRHLNAEGAEYVVCSCGMIAVRERAAGKGKEQVCRHFE